MFSYAASRRLRPVGITLAALLALAACSGSPQSSTSSVGGRDGVAVAPAPAPGAPAGGPAADGLAAEKMAVDPNAAARTGGSVAELLPNDTKIIRTASIYLTVTSVETAAAAVRGVAAGLGGQVASETVNATDQAPSADPALGGKAIPTTRRIGNYGQLVLAIPSERLDAALDQLSKLGTVVQRATASEDVTAAYIDTESRIATKKTSIDRVRALMTQTQNLSQIVELESQLAQREAELESLQAQLANMTKRVAMSMVTVTVSTNPEVVTPVEENGFMTGLRSGWKAFLASLGVGLTVLGALLPWAIALALIALPLLAWRRRRAAASAPTPSPAPAAAPPLAPTTAATPDGPGAQPAQVPNA